MTWHNVRVQWDSSASRLASSNGSRSAVKRPSWLLVPSVQADEEKECGRDVARAHEAAGIELDHLLAGQKLPGDRDEGKAPGWTRPHGYHADSGVRPFRHSHRSARRRVRDDGVRKLGVRSFRPPLRLAPLPSKPQHRNEISGKRSVGGKERKALNLRLSDEKPVEGISMKPRQALDGRRVVRSHWKRAEPHLFRARFDVGAYSLRQFELPERRFDCNFPHRHSGQVPFVRSVNGCPDPSWDSLGLERQSKEHACVEKHAHQLYFRKSRGVASKSDAIVTFPRSMPKASLGLRGRTGTSRTSGFPDFARMISSPRTASSIRADKCVFAS